MRRLCALLGAGRTWYYTHPTAATLAARDTALRDAIERVVLEFPGYGYRRVAKALQRAGERVNHKRVLRVLREEALLCHGPQAGSPAALCRHHRLAPRPADLAQSPRGRHPDALGPSLGR